MASLLVDGLHFMLSSTAPRPAQKVIMAKGMFMQEEAHKQYDVWRTDNSHVNETKSQPVCSASLFKQKRVRLGHITCC